MGVIRDVSAPNAAIASATARLLHAIDRYIDAKIAMSITGARKIGAASPAGENRDQTRARSALFRSRDDLAAAIGKALLLAAPSEIPRDRTKEP